MAMDLELMGIDTSDPKQMLAAMKEILIINVTHPQVERPTLEEANELVYCLSFGGLNLIAFIENLLGTEV